MLPVAMSSPLIQQQQLETDILVAGGGPAGVPCALAAAREGARVILVQDRPVLGGNASSEVRMHIVGADAFGSGPDLECEAREGGIIEEIRLETAVRNPQRSATMLDLILYEKCRAEPNLTLLLNTTVVGTEVHGDRIMAAHAVRESTQEHFTIQAKVFADCTGDGRLGAEAGAPFMRGREDKTAFDETHALDQADEKTLGSTLLYQARKHNQPMPFVAPAFARKFTEDDLKHRLHINPKAIDGGLEYGFWWCEWGGELDTITDNETIRDELMAILMGVWDVIKNSGRYPGTENWALDWFGWLPGKRESRRFIGQHILTERDVLTATNFPDTIAFGGWPIDLHPPAGVDAIEEKPCQHISVPHLYGIPLRSCVGSKHRNLVFAGRNFSATHVAFASTRVMATCAVMGQGVGTAAAVSILRDIEIADLAERVKPMHEVQQRLLRADSFLPGAINQDNADLARRARVTASSHQPGGEPEQIGTGQTRAIHGERGVRPELTTVATHRWMSDPADGLPATLELHWEEPVTLSQIDLVFDTGMFRKLTFSQCDAYTRSVVWGQPQPETVRDYTLEVPQPDGSWEKIEEISGNYQRLCQHKLAKSVTTSRLRLTVLKTNGLDHARVFEVRAYA